MAHAIKRGVEADHGREPPVRNSGIFTGRPPGEPRPLRVGDPGRGGARAQIGALVALLFGALVVVCLATGVVSSPHGTAASWLVTACPLWLCTAPAWLFCPDRRELGRLCFRGTIAFVLAVGAALVAGALAEWAANGVP